MLARTRNSVAVLGLSVAAAGGGLVGAPSAQAATSYNGYCKDASSTTVVVDLGKLGGGVVVRCAPAPLPGSANGLAALQRAGIPYTGTQRYGDTFVCRLYNKPSVGQSLPIAGNPGYKERCLNTPPTSAHWVYWYASNGGSWTDSSVGLTGHTAIRGGFEGWTFSLNSADSQPRVAPVRPAAAGAPKPPTKSQPPRRSQPPATPTSPATSTTRGKPAPHPTTSASSSSGRSPERSTGSKGSGSQPPSSSGASTRNPTSTTSRPSGAASTRSPDPTPGTSSNTSLPAAGSAPLADSNKLAAQARSQESSDSGINLPTVLGLGVLAVLAVTGTGVLLYRRFR